jgi:putative heme iron utilization protein
VTTPDPVDEVTDRLGAAAERLAELADEPVAEHVARYDELHGELQDALAAIDEV